MPDFSLLNTPNFAQAALGGFEAGRQVRRQQTLDAAQERKDRREEQAAALVAKAFGGGAPQPALGGAPAPTAAPAALTSPIAQADDIDRFMPGKTPGSVAVNDQAEIPAQEIASSIPQTVRRPDGLNINMDAIRELATIPGQSDMAMKLYQFAQTADKQNLEKVQRHLAAKAGAADYLLTVPEGPQRAAAFRQIAPDLLAQGFTEDDLRSADLSDGMLNRDRLMGMTLEQRTSERNSIRDDERAERIADESREDRQARLALARAAAERANRADARAAVRFKERGLDRAAVAASGGVRTDLSDLDY